MYDDDMIYAYELLDIGKLKCTRVRQGQKDVDTYRKHRGFFPYLFEDEFNVPSLIYWNIGFWAWTLTCQLVCDSLCIL